MHYIFDIFGMIAAFALIKYRETVGDAIGDADWMRHVGGVYNLVVLIGVFIFLWAIADMTGTTGFLFSPLRFLIPGVQQQPLGDF